MKALPRRLRPRRQGHCRWKAVSAKTAERAAWDGVRYMRLRFLGPSCPRGFSAPRSHREYRYRPFGGHNSRGGTRRRLGVVPQRGVAAIVSQPTAPPGPRRNAQPPRGTKELPAAPLNTRPAAGLLRRHQATCDRSTAAAFMAAAAAATAKAPREKGGISPGKQRPPCARSWASEVTGAVRRSQISIASSCSAARSSVRANFKTMKKNAIPRSPWPTLSLLRDNSDTKT